MFSIFVSFLFSWHLCLLNGIIFCDHLLLLFEKFVCCHFSWNLSFNILDFHCCFWLTKAILNTICFCWVERCWFTKVFWLLVYRSLLSVFESSTLKKTFLFWLKENLLKVFSFAFLTCFSLDFLFFCEVKVLCFLS